MAVAFLIPFCLNLSAGISLVNIEPFPWIFFILIRCSLVFFFSAFREFFFATPPPPLKVLEVVSHSLWFLPSESPAILPLKSVSHSSCKAPPFFPRPGTPWLRQFFPTSFSGFPGEPEHFSPTLPPLSGSLYHVVIFLGLFSIFSPAPDLAQNPPPLVLRKLS